MESLDDLVCTENIPAVAQMIFPHHPLNDYLAASYRNRLEELVTILPKTSYTISIRPDVIGNVLYLNTASQDSRCGNLFEISREDMYGFSSPVYESTCYRHATKNTLLLTMIMKWYRYGVKHYNNLDQMMRMKGMIDLVDHLMHNTPEAVNILEHIDARILFYRSSFLKKQVMIIGGKVNFLESRCLTLDLPTLAKEIPLCLQQYVPEILPELEDTLVYVSDAYALFFNAHEETSMRLSWQDCLIITALINFRMQQEYAHVFKFSYPLSQKEHGWHTIALLVVKKENRFQAIILDSLSSPDQSQHKAIKSFMRYLSDDQTYPLHAIPPALMRQVEDRHIPSIENLEPYIEFYRIFDTHRHEASLEYALKARYALHLLKALRVRTKDSLAFDRILNDHAMLDLESKSTHLDEDINNERFMAASPHEISLVVGHYCQQVITAYAGIWKIIGRFDSFLFKGYFNISGKLIQYLGSRFLNNTCT